MNVCMEEVNFNDCKRWQARYLTSQHLLQMFVTILNGTVVWTTPRNKYVFYATILYMKCRFFFRFLFSVLQNVGRLQNLAVVFGDFFFFFFWSLWT